MTQQESGVTPIFNPGIGLLQLEQTRPNLTWTPVPKIKEHDDFDDEGLNLEWNFLRSPRSKWYAQKNGFMEIKLRPEMVTELVNPSLIAQRTRHFDYLATAKLSFKTKKHNEKAGLVIYRRHGNNYQLLKGKDEIILVKVLQEENKGEFEPIVLANVPYKKENVILRAKVNGLKIQFLYGENEHDLKPIGDIQDYTLVSDEVAKRFNGVYIGMYATSSGEKSTQIARFDWFTYEGK